jgi:probable lipoprotein NlpC
MPMCLIEEYHIMRMISLYALPIVLIASQAARAENIRVRGLETVRLPQKIVHEAFSFLGTPYSYGGGTDAGVDCSGLVCAVFKKAADSELARTTEGLFSSGKPAETPLHAGDLLFFDTEDQPAAGGTDPSHVGIFIGNGAFIHAASKGERTGVIISSLSERYYAERYVGARRMIEWKPPLLELTMRDVHDSYSIPDPLPPRIPLEIRVRTAGEARGIVFRAEKDGGEIFTRRLFQPTSTLPIVTQPGTWTLRVGPREGEGILVVSFRVAEK